MGLVSSRLDGAERRLPKVEATMSSGLVQPSLQTWRGVRIKPHKYSNGLHQIGHLRCKGRSRLDGEEVRCAIKGIAPGGGQ